MASDNKWQIVMWISVLNLKPSAEKFEEGMTVKMINEPIITALVSN